MKISQLLQIALIKTVFLACFITLYVFAEEEILTGFRPKGCSEDSECLVTVLNVRNSGTLYVMFRNNTTATVRLIGVKNPESPDSSTVEKIKKYLEMDKIFPIIKLEFDSVPKDKDNNLLAYVYYRGQMLNTWIISKGLGKYNEGEKNIKYQDKFKSVVGHRLK